MDIYPIPRRSHRGPGRWNYSGRDRLQLPETAGFALKRAARRWAEEISAGLSRPIEVTAGRVASERLLLRLTLEPELAAEHFRLAATADGFTAAGGDDAACFYALQAAGTLLSGDRRRVPEIRIEDGPALPRRGYMLDVSRCKVPTLASLKRMIGELARLRYNELQLYMEHTFAFAGDERVWFDSSPLTPGEIMELDECCRDHFIELVPNLNSFGHLERWLAFEEYRHLAECPTPWFYEDWQIHCRGTLTPGPEALAFIDRLYAEMLPNFTSRRVNIGCDETLELGEGRSKERCARHGKSRVYLDFLTGVAKLANSHGKEAQFWGEIVVRAPEFIPELPPGITANSWGYTARYPFAEETARFRAAGIPFSVCPGTSTWCSLTGNIGNMTANILNAIGNGFRAGAQGMLLTDWGDGGHHQYWPLSWPGLGLAAGAAWNPGAELELQAALPAAIGRIFTPETADPRLGEMYQELGRIPGEFRNPPPGVRTLYHSALFKPEWAGTTAHLDNVRPAEIHAARRRLRHWRRELASRPGLAPPLVRAELDNAAAMADCALLRLAMLKRMRVDRPAWRDALRRVIGRHTDLWLARNRPGGLAESSGWLRRALETPPC